MCLHDGDDDTHYSNRINMLFVHCFTANLPYILLTLQCTKRGLSKPTIVIKMLHYDVFRHHDILLTPTSRVYTHTSIYYLNKFQQALQQHMLLPTVGLMPNSSRVSNTELYVTMRSSYFVHVGYLLVVWFPVTTKNMLVGGLTMPNCSLL